MDKQLIYVIFIVAYLAYTYYRKSQNKKTVVRRIDPDDSQQSPENKKPVPTKNFLERMILGEEFFEQPAAQDVRQPVEEVPQQTSAVSQPQQPVLAFEANNLPPKKIETITQLPPQNTFRFNLKHAVIYNVILERPYK